MTESASEKRRQLEASLARNHRELGRAVDDLRGAAREAMTPPRLIGRHPYAWVLAAFAIGAWIGHRHTE